MKMKLIKYSISLLLSLSLNKNLWCQGLEREQTRSNLSFGLTFGYKTDGGSFAIQFGYLIKRVIDVNLHVGANKYEGAAFGVGIKGFILPKHKFKPYLGITYDYFDSHGSGFTLESDTIRTRYTKGINNVILFQGGILYEEQPGSLFISLNYKTTFPGNYLILQEGPRNEDIENKASKIYAPGLGITVGIIFHWWGREPEEKVLKNAQF